MRVEYDKYGNATDYFYKEDRAVSIEIKNEYNKQKLLIRRYVYTNKSEGELKLLSRIQRFVYDQNPLVYRLQKGGLNQENN